MSLAGIEGKRLASAHRRSKRLALHVPVLVYGHTRANFPFCDITRMISVNAHGGLLALEAPVQPGQVILLVNNATQESRACRAVYVGEEEAGKYKVGIEFIRPAPRFWKVQFPNDNLKLASRRAEPRLEAVSAPAH